MNAVPQDDGLPSGAGASPPAAAALQAFEQFLVEAGEPAALRLLDVAFARFVARHDPAAPLSLLLAAAWCSRAAGDGHLCVDLNAWAQLLSVVLAVPAAGAAPDDAARPARRASESDVLDRWLGALPEGAAAAVEWSAAGAALARVTAGVTATQAPGVQAPLVLQGTRLYLGRHWHTEQRIAARLLARVEPGTDSGLSAEAAAARDAWLERLFPVVASLPPASPVSAPDRQREACERTAAARLTVVTGGPGTGKTYTAARMLVMLSALQPPARPLRVVMAAPTGKAAARLRESFEAAWADLRRQHPTWPWAQLDISRRLEVGTLHRLLGLTVGAGPPRRAAAGAGSLALTDVWLVDEASMIDADMMSTLLGAVPAHARLVLLGDADQLASVEAGSVLADITQAAALAPQSALAVQTVHLTESRRFSGAIGQLALAIRDQDVSTVQAMLAQAATPSAPDDLRWRPQPLAGGRGSGPASWAVSEAGAHSHAGWMRLLAEAPAAPNRQPPGDASPARSQDPNQEHAQGSPDAFLRWVAAVLEGFQRFRVLCALREGPLGVAGLNQAIEQLAAARGWIRPTAGAYEGRAVMVTRNDAGIGLYNGDTGVVLRAAAGPLRQVGLAAWFATPQGPRAVSLSRLPPVETALAMTVHKSQGSEFAHALLVLPAGDHPVMTRELLYTGVTRAKTCLTICAPSSDALVQALPRRTLRFSGLAERLRAPHGQAPSPSGAPRHAPT